MDSARAEVLVVEDDPELNELVGAYVSIAGFAYRSALNGGDALSEVRRRVPAAVVLDLMLPDMSGFDVSAQIKRGTRTGQIPIIILTALHDDASRQRGLECGAAEYLSKPFNPDDLIGALTRHAAPAAGP